MRSLLAALVIVSGSLCAAPAPCEPVNSRATAEARALLNTICGISGKGILAGQHNFPGNGSGDSERAAKLARRYPYLWGSDFGFSASGKNGIDSRDRIIEEAVRQHTAGSLITLMWHAVRPIDDEPASWNSSVNGELNDGQWKALITPGSALHLRWQAQIDNVAQYLKRLREAKIAVLWRPYHEGNMRWPWWGGRPGPHGFQELYRMMFDRYVNFHHLDNLVWVWDSGQAAGDLADYDPGASYADILATDAYQGFEQNTYNRILSLAKGRPIALGEVGSVPTPAILKNQPLWTWFMVWPDYLGGSNSRGDMYKLYNDQRTLSRGMALPAGR